MKRNMKILGWVTLGGVIVALMIVGWVSNRSNEQGLGNYEQEQEQSVEHAGNAVGTDNAVDLPSQSEEQVEANLDERCNRAQLGIDAYLANDRAVLAEYLSPLGQEWVINAPVAAVQTITDPAVPVSNYLSQTDGGCEVVTNLGKWLVRISRSTPEVPWAIDAILPSELTMIEVR